MRRFAILAGMAIGVLLIGVGIYLLVVRLSAAYPGAGNSPVAAAEPEPAHDFTLMALTGETVSLSDYRGKWVLVNFWATWCPPCVKEMPYLQKIAGTRNNIVVVGINLKESTETVAKFAADYNITFPVLFNPDDTTLRVYQARSLPRTFVITPDGNIALRVIGELNPTDFDNWLNTHLPD